MEEKQEEMDNILVRKKEEWKSEEEELTAKKIESEVGRFV